MTIGNWYYPNGQIVRNISDLEARNDLFVRLAQVNQMRLVSQRSLIKILGVYRCVVLSDGRNFTAFINITRGSLEGTNQC